MTHMKRRFLILLFAWLVLAWGWERLYSSPGLDLPRWVKWAGPTWVTRAEIPGQDGERVVTRSGEILNRYASLAVDAPRGSAEIILNYHDGPGGMVLGDLRAGDLILIMQMAGASIETMDGPGYGAITALNSAGLYEYVTVNRVRGRVVTVNPPCGGLLNSYQSSSRAQVIRVPQYRSLRIAPGASVTAPPWNGRVGGIVALQVDQEMVLEGTIDVSGRGFRGGALSGAGGGLFRSDFVSSQQDFGAEKGESIAGYQETYDLQGGRYGRGAAINGGGGGTAHNSGGGGGANGNRGGEWTGHGVMDANAVGAIAWQLDPFVISQGGRLANSSGGGRGGHSFSDKDGNGTIEAPGDPVWGGDRRREVGGRGGRPVPQDPSQRLFFGGGGGAGAQNNESGGAGGDAGGMIYVIANKVSGNGELRADGEAGQDTRNEHRDGAGGGGAGGTIVIVAKELRGPTARARGGVGGVQKSSLFPNEVESQGPGAGGGGGYIAYSGGEIGTDVSGGANGLSLSVGVTEFPANGATSGAPGLVVPTVGQIPFCRTTTDLAIRKRLEGSQLIPGTPAVYTIEVTNAGPANAFGADVIDLLPATFVRDETRWTCSASGGASCLVAEGEGDLTTRINLPVGGQVVFRLEGMLASSALGAITNTAEVRLAAGAIDSNPTNNRASVTTPVRPIADLRITKTNQRDWVLAGEEVVYTVEVTNAGPSDAVGFEVIDLAPPGWTVTEVRCQAWGGSCGNDRSSGQTIRWQGASLRAGPGPSLTFSMRGRVATSARGVLANTVRIVIPPTAGFEDPGVLPNEAIDSDPLLALSDLVIEKTASAPVGVPGERLSWTIQVRTQGPSDADGFSIVDELPSSFREIEISCQAMGGSCGVNRSQGQRLEFADARLQVGSGNHLRLTITGRIDPGATGNLINTAQVSISGGIGTVNAPLSGGQSPSWTDPDPSSNQATAVVPLTPIADLRVTKTNRLTSVVAGEAVTYWMDVVNAGPSDTGTFEIVDLLPTGFRVTAARCVATGGSCGTERRDEDRIGWRGASLRSGPAHSLQIVVEGVLDAGVAGEVVNTVSALPPSGADWTDPDLSSNVATDRDPIRQVADLAIVKQSGSASVAAGSTISFQLDVSNLGPSRAANVVVTDLLPPGLEKGTWTCQPLTGGRCQASAGTGGIDARVDLEPGGRVRFVLQAKVVPDLEGSSIINTASVQPPASTEDRNPSNNRSSAEVSIHRAADLQILKTATSSTARPGETFTYTLLVTNRGPSVADQVVVQDTMPEGLDVVTVTTSQGSCSGGVSLVCSLGRLLATSPGDQATIQITVRIPIGFRLGPVVNTATVASATFDTDTTNNRSSHQTLVSAPPGAEIRSIAIQSTNANSCLGEGEVINLTISITNTGDGAQQDNPGAELTAQLPIDLIGILGSCSASRGTCRMGSQLIEWDGALLPNEKVTISYQVRVRSGTFNGARVCTTYRVHYDANGDGVNETPVAREECRINNCPTNVTCSGPNCPGLGPGDASSNQTNPVSSSQRIGSILLFPLYSSSSTLSSRHNTRINITNVDPFRSAYLHLFFVEGVGATVADSFLCLTANQTVSFLMSDLDPEVTGYLMVVAVDENGCPIQQNSLIGDAFFRLDTGHAGNIAAEAITALNVIPPCSRTATTTRLQFDGVQYSMLGQTVAASHLPSLASGERTMIVLASIGGSLADKMTSIGTLFGLIFNDTEQGFSFSTTEGCQMMRILNSSYPRSTPRFPTIIPAGRSGWMKVWPTELNQAFVGLIVTDAAGGVGYEGARALHKLTLGPTSVEMPVIAPSCR